MQPVGFDYEIKTILWISGSDLMNYHNLVSRHYDAKCRGAAAVGGFLHGWATRWLMTHSVDMEWAELCKTIKASGQDKEIMVNASQDNLGTLAKICEPEAGMQYKKFLDLIEAGADEYHRLKPQN